MSAEAAIGLLAETCAKAASVGASALTEPELYAILSKAGLRVPRHEVLRPDGSSKTTLTGEIVRGDERGVARDMLLLSAAAALVAAGVADDFHEGLRVSAQAIDFGDAWGTFELLRETSHGR